MSDFDIVAIAVAAASSWMAIGRHVLRVILGRPRTCASSITSYTWGGTDLAEARTRGDMGSYIVQHGKNGRCAGLADSRCRAGLCLFHCRKAYHCSGKCLEDA